MGAIQFTDRGTAARVSRETRTLAQAAVAALPAPSLFNTQPWRWRISDEGGELRADRGRQLRSMDPDGRLLTVSCGIALHHALISLAAQGAQVEVDRFPRLGDTSSPHDISRSPDGQSAAGNSGADGQVGLGSDPDLLARIRVVGDPRRPDPAAVRLNAVMSVRRTDRRPFSEDPIPPERLARLCSSVNAAAVSNAGVSGAAVKGPVVNGPDANCAAVSGAGPDASMVHLHLLRPEEVASLTAVVGRASVIESRDPDYQADLLTWTHRELGEHDGILADQMGGSATARPVPVRRFSDTVEDCPGCPPVVDRAARYAVIFTDRDEPQDWLAAGEALSALLLTAADLGIAVSPMSDVVEVPLTRWHLRSLLAGMGYPVVVLRLGMAQEPVPASTTPRRSAAEIIELVGGRPGGEH